MHSISWKEKWFLHIANIYRWNYYLKLSTKFFEKNVIYPVLIIMFLITLIVYHFSLARQETLIWYVILLLLREKAYPKAWIQQNWKIKSNFSFRFDFDNARIDSRPSTCSSGRSRMCVAKQPSEGVFLSGLYLPPGF